MPRSSTCPAVAGAVRSTDWSLVTSVASAATGSVPTCVSEVVIVASVDW